MRLTKTETLVIETLRGGGSLEPARWPQRTYTLREPYRYRSGAMSCTPIIKSVRDTTVDQMIERGLITRQLKLPDSEELLPELTATTSEVETGSPSTPGEPCPDPKTAP